MDQRESGHLQELGDYMDRPSWTDAQMCLELINEGKADGNKFALILRSCLQRLLFKYGCFVQQNFVFPLVAGLLLMAMGCVGIVNMKVETELQELWVPDNGRLIEENDYRKTMKDWWSEQEGSRAGHSPLKRQAASQDKEWDSFIEKRGWWNVLNIVQTPQSKGKNILTRDDLLLHAQLLSGIAQLSVEVDSGNERKNWTMADLCYKPVNMSSPRFSDLNSEYREIAQKVIPCIVLTPLDCFWDASKLQAPVPLPTGNTIIDFVKNIILKQDEINWKTLNPGYVINKLTNISISLAPISPKFGDYVKKAEKAKAFMVELGILNGYQGKPCIDPLDQECPNRFRISCNVTEEFVEWNKNQQNPVPLEADPDPQNRTCEMYKNAVKKLNETERKLLHRFVLDPDYHGRILKDGCSGLAENYLRWPQPIIIGGAEEKDNETSLSKAEALQTMILLSPNNLKHLHVKKAKHVMNTWVRRVKDYIHNYAKDSDGEPRFRPFSLLDIEAMMEEYASFKYFTVLIGYFLMLLYAGFSLFSTENAGVNSCCGLAVFGVVLVTFASISGLGCGVWLGIHFNPTTTQIVPFLSLGLGVNDMFIFLHNYVLLAKQKKEHEVGHLMKETGISVFLTSTSSILSFLAGSFIPIPAMRSFCLQVTPQFSHVSQTKFLVISLHVIRSSDLFLHLKIMHMFYKFQCDYIPNEREGKVQMKSVFPNIA